MRFGNTVSFFSFKLNLCIYRDDVQADKQNKKTDLVTQTPSSPWTDGQDGRDRKTDRQNRHE